MFEESHKDFQPDFHFPPEEGEKKQEREKEIEKFTSPAIEQQLRAFVVRQLQGGEFKRNKALVDDLVQQTYMNALEGLNGFKGESKLETWLFRIAANVVAGHFRKASQRKEFVEFDEKAHETYVEEPDSSLEEVVSTRVDEERTRDFLPAALEKLSPILRKTLLIRFEKSDLSLSELAQELTMPVGTLKARLFRAMKQVKEDIETEMLN
jgi:RNA polymerase sigma-70 factor (ECF subfamily)